MVNEKQIDVSLQPELEKLKTSRFWTDKKSLN